MEMEFLKRVKSHRATSQQIESIIQFMEQNPLLCNGKLSLKFSKNDRKQKWEELSRILNSDGWGAKKTPEQWRKCWNDQKSEVRTKAAKLRKEIQKTGDQNAGEKLTPLQERIMSIVGWAAAVRNEEIFELEFVEMNSRKSPIVEMIVPSCEIQSAPSIMEDLCEVTFGDAASPSSSETPCTVMNDEINTQDKKECTDSSTHQPPNSFELLLKAQNSHLEVLADNAIKQTALMERMVAAVEHLINDRKN